MMKLDCKTLSKLFFTVGLALILSRAAKAQNGRIDTAAVASLPKLIQEALENNPDIQAAERRWLAARQRPAQVSTLPDPMLGYTRWIESVETRVGPQENVFMLSQRIPFPGKLGLMGNIAREEAAAAEQRYHATRRDVVFKVKSAYYDLYWIDQSLAILDQYLAVLRDFARVAETKYATGAGIQANVLKAQVEITSVMERRLGFERLRTGAVARLNALLSRPADTPLGVAAEMDTARLHLPESALYRAALERRQELLAAQAMVRRSEAGRRLAKKTYLPDFRIQATYITIPTVSSMFSDAGKDAYSLQVGLNLPMWLGKRRAAVTEAEENLVANQLAFENLKNNVESEIADLRFQLETIEKTLDLYEQGLLAQAESSLQSALSAYKTGKLDFLNLLDAERMLLQFRLGYVREQSNYQKKVAAIERAIGGRLPE